MISTGFGNRLKAFRTEHHLTQRELAEMMDISVNHVSVLERGIKQPRASTEAAFARLSGQYVDQVTGAKESIDLLRLKIDEKLWGRLCKLDKRRRTEVMWIFFQIIEWTKYRG